ncbi:MAG: flippase-like domain-containing protein [Chloroflexi bacterium]|nr:flippase-like domain-containing protein [Chloroflexota bacterium]MCI0802452.1 flippase-like domain-containing protein [Chloroflexota bacterium]MCI0846992.1 flippase-like domain-containing protein [Chloroflexota bacterium]MCI0896893.1 flippase-like domain-containing protein [Chloroflexota bacterium]MCI0899536.1 flippase-like domain-containing protein [Chloroflexota bacterium]
MPAVLMVGVFVALAGYGDFGGTVDKIRDLPVLYLFAALGLASANFLLRFLRWAFYLKVLKIDAPAGISALVFLSGLAMSITPGKAGELVKCYLLNSRTGAPVSRSAPVVVMERLTDVISVIILGLTGFALLPMPVVVVLAVALVVSVAGLLFAVSRQASRLAGLPILSRWSELLRDSQEGFKELAAPRVMAAGVAMGVVAWFAEGLALWLILKGIGSDIPLVRALPIYAAATLVGAVTALPGGLVGTEGSMLALLQQSGLTRAGASAGTVLVRLVTLWFAVAVGLVALLALRRVPVIEVEKN